MTNSDNLSEVEELLTERDAVVGWLTRLDTAGDTIPAAVQDRVRLDYQLRLDGVTHRLKGHTDIITAKLGEDRAEHAEHAASEKASREALAEAELRHLVGEYDADRFAKEKGRHEVDLSRCGAALAAVAERVTGLEQLLAMISAAPRATPAEQSSRPTLSQPSQSAPPQEDAPSPDDLIDLVSEEDQLLAVFDEAPESTELEIELVDTEDDAEEEPEPSSEDVGHGRLSFRPGTGMPTEREREIPSFGMPAEVPARFIPSAEAARPVPSKPAAPPSRPEPTPRRAPVFEEDIVASGPTPAPAGRTARCGECSAMNRTSEWYCEKCGAELTMA